MNPPDNEEYGEEFSDYWFEVKEDFYISPQEAKTISHCFIKKQQNSINMSNDIDYWDLLIRFSSKKTEEDIMYISYRNSDHAGLVLKQKMFLYKLSKYIRRAKELGYI